MLNASAPILSQYQIGYKKNSSLLFNEVCSLAFMFCPNCIQSMRVPTKFECFICLESIRIEFVPLGYDLLAAKLKYLQRGGGCCKKSEKNGKKVGIMGKKSPQNFFFQWKRVFRSEIT